MGGWNQDVNVSHPVADLFKQAATLNADDDRRRGNVVYLGSGCRVIATGDIHGNREALNRIIRYADLSGRSETRLILQEIVHGPVDPRTKHDRSIEVLLRAARLKIAHPREVLFLMGNHDVAELTGNEITRAGQPSCKTFAAGVAFAFGEAAGEVTDAMKEFLYSLPLAVVCPNNVLLSHSLPSPGRITDECFAVLERPYSPEDMRRGGGVYEWTWGRRHTEEMVADFARRMTVDYFILGHVHSPDGFDRVTPQAITLACDHGRGCVLPFSTDSPLTDELAESGIRRVAALAGAT